MEESESMVSQAADTTTTTSSAKQVLPRERPRSGQEGTPAHFHSDQRGGAKNRHSHHEHGSGHENTPHGDAAGHHHSPHEEIEDRLLSIGIDIGSATTQLAISELSIGRRDARVASKPEVLSRNIVFESSGILTPYRNEWEIDAEEVEKFVREEVRAAAIGFEQIDTGAVICTGEAARKNNAEAISQRVSVLSGDFVCVTAGHSLEARLGAHGSGAVQRSRRLANEVVLLDVGGGTAKRTLLRRGRIVNTSAINVGTRLVAFDGARRVIRLEKAGRRLLEASGVEGCVVGSELTTTQEQMLADRMSLSLVQFLGLSKTDALTRSLMLDGELEDYREDAYLALAGGLAEYIFSRISRGMGDLGMSLARSLKADLHSLLPAGRILDPGTGIQATVVGAGQYSVQVSGDTVYVDSKMFPPIKGVAVRSVEIDWSRLSTAHVRERLSETVAAADQSRIVGFAFKDMPPGYGIARDLADILAQVLPEIEVNGVVLIFASNVARTVGIRLSAAARDVPVMCLDEVDVGDLDFLDIGPPHGGNAYLPVVVKTVVFS